MGKVRKVHDLLKALRSNRSSEFRPPEGMPSVSEGHVLPEDLREFYTLCGGATLFQDSAYRLKICQPAEIRLANPVIVGELCPEDITSSWYIIASDQRGGYLTIDMAPDRAGRCYDSFWDRHGIVGSCPIIATSFTDFLGRLIKSKGAYWYWLRDDFDNLGDAYDGT